MKSKLIDTCTETTKILRLEETSVINLIDPKIQKYAIEHTTPLDPHLDDLVRITYATMQLPQMISGAIEGMLLQFLVWATNATRVLDIGTFTGFSAQMMASAMPQNGIVITCESDPKIAQIAQQYFDISPDRSKIRLLPGDASETLKTLDGPFDIVFIDAEKTAYHTYYEQAIKLLAPKGIIAIDNVLWGGRVLNPESISDKAIAAINEHVLNDSRVKNVLLPIRDGVMLVHMV